MIDLDEERRASAARYRGRGKDRRTTAAGMTLGQVINAGLLVVLVFAALAAGGALSLALWFYVGVIGLSALVTLYQLAKKAAG